MKKIKKTQIRTAKNVVRGTFNKPKAPYLEQIHHYGAPRKSATDLVLESLASLTQAEIGPFLEWMSGYPGKMASVYPRDPLRDPSRLAFSDVQSEMSLCSRIQFLSVILYNSRADLMEFSAQRLQLEEEILRGRYSEAEVVLDDIERVHGISMWGIELRIALLQLARGLEAQKEYFSELSSSAPRCPAAIVAFWVSQRNEEGTVYARFQSRLKASISRWKTRDSTAAIYRYLLGLDRLADLPDSLASTVLGSVASLSLIDAYMSVRDAISAVVERGELPPEPAITAFDAACPEQDPVLRRLRMLATFRPGQSANSSLSEVGSIAPTPTDLRTGRALGDLLDKAHPGNNRPLSEQPAETSLFEEFERLIELAVARTPEFAHVVDRGLKRLSNFRHLDTSRVISAFVTLQSRSTPVFRLSTATPLFLFSDCSTAWQAAVLPKAPAQRILASASASRIRDSVAEALNPALSNSVATELTVELISRDAISNLKPSDALEALNRSAGNALVDRRLTPLFVQASLMLNDIDAAVGSAGLLCAEDDEAGWLLPLEELVRELRAVRFKVKDKISLALALHEYLKEKDDREVFQQLQFAYEDTLASFSVERPSDLVNSTTPATLQKIQSFLRKVAVPAVMDVSFWLFKNSRDVLAERISVCSALMTLDSERGAHYRDEIKEITRVIDIERGIEDVDRSRVFIDLPRLGRWANQELRESFDRYKALTRAGVGYENPSDFEKLLKDFLAGKDVIFTELPQYSKDEAGQLLIEILSAIVQRYFHDEDFGLDAYLSMRVRHGSLAGHLRGPLEEVGLLVARDKATGKFPVPLEWTDLSEQIVQFSSTYEKIVEELAKDRLQIRSAEHPKGLFHFELQMMSVHYVRSRIDEATTLDEFLARVYEVLNVFLERSLQEVRTYITYDFRERAEEALAALANANDAEIAPERRSELQNAIAAVSPDWQASVDRVASWFAPSEENERAALRTLEQIVQIAVQATRNAHRGFDPQLELDIDDLGPQAANVLVLFTDLLFTILDNVHRHCAVDGRPKVSISLKAQRADESNLARVVLRVHNEAVATARSAAVLARLDRIRDQIKSGDYKSRVKLEGGTGLLKLKRILAPDDRQTLDFGFDKDGFFVEISIVLVFLS